MSEVIESVKITSIEYPEKLTDPLHIGLELIKEAHDQWKNLSPDKRVYFSQLGMLAAVQVADILATTAVLQSSPQIFEGNPIVRSIIDHSPSLMVLAKMGFAACQIVFLELMRSQSTADQTSQIGKCLRLYNAFYASAALNNTTLILLNTIK